MKNTTNIPEKTPYTTVEKLAEILCGVMAAASLAFYIHLVSARFNAAGIISVMVIAAAVYGVLTMFSVHPELISKPTKIHKNRRIFLAVKSVLTALLLAALVIMTFPVYEVVCY